MKSRNVFRLAVFAACLVAGPVLAQTPESIFDEDPIGPVTNRIPDRLEGFNRAMFKFNDVVYRYTLRPFSKGYRKVVPSTARRGINSFFHNLAFPKRFLGNVLEGKFDGAATETGRFVVNTVSSLGFAQTANRFPALKERPSDLGHAFGTWGIGHGSYLILPIMGPTSIRDGIGEWASYWLDPVYYLEEWEHRAIANGVRIGNQTPELMDAYAMLETASIDPYIALREAYSVRRNMRAEGSGERPVPSLDKITEPEPKE